VNSCACGLSRFFVIPSHLWFASKMPTRWGSPFFYVPASIRARGGAKGYKPSPTNKSNPAAFLGGGFHEGLAFLRVLPPGLKQSTILLASRSPRARPRTLICRSTRYSAVCAWHAQARAGFPDLSCRALHAHPHGGSVWVITGDRGFDTPVSL
jgi:hypothetical protein